jgi:hypothetical protein
MWRRRAAIRRAPLAELICREIDEAGRAASSALMERMRTTHNELFYALGKPRGDSSSATLWRTSREEVTAKLFDALMMLLCGHRYATPKKALHLIHTNAETRKLFSRRM